MRDHELPAERVEVGAAEQPSGVACALVEFEDAALGELVDVSLGHERPDPAGSDRQPRGPKQLLRFQIDRQYFLAAEINGIAVDAYQHGPFADRPLPKHLRSSQIDRIQPRGTHALEVQNIIDDLRGAD